MNPKTDTARGKRHARAQKLKAKCSERGKGDLDANGICVDKYGRISPTVD
jgi:hypothetical protein